MTSEVICRNSIQSAALPPLAGHSLGEFLLAESTRREGVSLSFKMRAHETEKLRAARATPQVPLAQSRPLVPKCGVALAAESVMQGTCDLQVETMLRNPGAAATHGTLVSSVFDRSGARLGEVRTAFHLEPRQTTSRAQLLNLAFDAANDEPLELVTMITVAGSPVYRTCAPFRMSETLAAPSPAFFLKR